MKRVGYILDAMIHLFCFDEVLICRQMVEIGKLSLPDFYDFNFGAIFVFLSVCILFPVALFCVSWPVYFVKTTRRP